MKAFVVERKLSISNTYNTYVILGIDPDINPAGSRKSDECLKSNLKFCRIPDTWPYCPARFDSRSDIKPDTEFNIRQDT